MKKLTSIILVVAMLLGTVATATTQDLPESYCYECNGNLWINCNYCCYACKSTACEGCCVGCGTTDCSALLEADNFFYYLDCPEYSCTNCGNADCVGVTFGGCCRSCKQNGHNTLHGINLDCPAYECSYCFSSDCPMTCDESQWYYCIDGDCDEVNCDREHSEQRYTCSFCKSEDCNGLCCWWCAPNEYICYRCNDENCPFGLGACCFKCGDFQNCKGRTDCANWQCFMCGDYDCAGNCCEDCYPENVRDFIPGRVRGNNIPIGIGDALHTLMFVAGMSNSIIAQEGEGSRAWQAATVSPQGIELGRPTINCALQILMYTANMPSSVLWNKEN